MPGGQRLAVHADRQQRVAAVVQQRGGKAGGPVVDRTAHDLIGALLDPGALQQIDQRHTGPDGVADEIAADPI